MAVISDRPIIAATAEFIRRYAKLEERAKKILPHKANALMLWGETYDKAENEETPFTMARLDRFEAKINALDF